jgi:hypothetical protein
MTDQTETRWTRELAAPIGPTTAGRLVIKPDAAHLTIRGDRGMTDLYRAGFESPSPNVRVQDGNLTVTFRRVAWLTNPRVLLGRHPSGMITLNGSIPWHIRVRGGTAHAKFDLSGLTLYALELGGGVSDMILTLSTPSGTVPVRTAAGVRDLTIVRPRGVAVSIRVGRGARRLTVDEQHFGAVGGSTRWQSPEYEQMADRYDIAISGGADTLTLMPATHLSTT